LQDIAPTIKYVVPVMQKDAVVQSVEISTIAHATDDPDKVQLALHNLLPESLRERQLFTRRYVEGHHGNPIVTFDARLTRPAEGEALAKHVISRLSRSERMLIVRDLALHVDDEGNLYVRVDKQQAFRRAVELSDEDPIRVRIKFNRLRGTVERLMRDFLESE